MKNNVEWVDSLKTIGILAVILGHIASPLGLFIFSWHMPLFFMIAGFFLKYEMDFKEFFIKNFKRLMVPYFIFTFVGISADTIKRIVLGRDKLDYANEFMGMFVWMDMSSLINTYAFVLWFLPALFFGKLILFFINRYFKNLWYQCLIVCILFIISFYVELPFGIDNAMNSALWIFIGFVMFNNFNKSKFLYLLPLAAILIYTILGIPSLDLATKNYSIMFVNVLWGVSIIYTLILLLKNTKYPNVLKVWGANTMLLFIIHPYTNNIANIFVEKIEFGDWYLTFFISLVLLQIVILIKLRFNNKGVFKYV